MSTTRTIAVIQARMGSSRLPGKVLADIEGKPLLAWTVASVQAIRGVAQVVVATTTDASDDPVVTLGQRLGIHVHRGSVYDVLARLHDAVAPFEPDVVVRQTADNPFPDPNVAAAQVRAVEERGLDYVGIPGWPIGIAAEACRFEALQAANREATERIDREHVMTFVWRQPERFRIGRLERDGTRLAAAVGARYTVDTDADLAFARALAARLGHEPPTSLGELEMIVSDEPAILELNAGVEQRSWRETDASGDQPWTS